MAPSTTTLKEHWATYELADLPERLSARATDTPTPTRFIDLMGESMTAVDWKDKVIFVMLLQVKHSTTTSGAKLGVTSLQRKDGGNKRAKLNNYADPKSWDRMYLFADLMDPGRCLVMLKTRTQESMSLTNIVRKRGGQILTGSLFAIFEPMPTDDRRQLGIMPMVTSDFPLLPLRDFTDANGRKETVPQYLPDGLGTGEQKYFVLHEVKSLNILMFNLDRENTCGGRECDKAHKLYRGNNCGCTTLSNQRHVGSMVVVFDNHFNKTNIHHLDKIQVTGFRSLRTTQLFFDNMEEYVSDYTDMQLKTVKQKVEKIVTYVNSNCGWTVVGWFRKGQTVESEVATNDTDLVESDTVIFHISCLVPTDGNIIKQDEYKKLLVDAPQP